MPSTLSVAAVQMNCEPGNVALNLQRAEQFIKAAVEKGAKLVLLPELMPSGYILTEAIWDVAETINGEIVKWLLDTAKLYNIYLGFSFLEADGEDFYNSFVLSGPRGKLLGRVRKNPPASVEAYFYRAGNDSHIIETDIGRIGVNICYENLLHDHICDLHRADIDLLLAPSAAGNPKKFLPGDIKRFTDMLINMRKVYAESLEVPVVMTNRTGPLETKLPSPFPFLTSKFPGLSSIVDSDGSVKSALGEEEGVIVAEVILDPERKTRGEPKCYGKMWATRVPWYAFTWPWSQHMGEKSYAKNPHRKQRALAISQGH